MDQIFTFNLTPPADRYVTMAAFFLTSAVFPVIGSAMLTNYYTYSSVLTMEFQKPWFLTWGIFLGPTLLFIPIAIHHKLKPAAPGQPVITWTLFRACAVPGLCLTLSSALDMYALIYLPAPLWQSVQSFSLIFATLINGALSHTKSPLIDWTGLLIVLIGIAVVGYSVMSRSNYLTDYGSSPFFSIIYMIIAQGVNAAKRFFEEKMIHEAGAYSLAVITYQSIWGCLICSFFILPLCSIATPTIGIGIYEDTLESFSMLGKSADLIILFIFYVILTAASNISSLQMISFYDSISLQNFSAILPCLVWPISVISHYIVNKDEVGEPVDYCTIGEIIGYGLLIVGTMIFNRKIKIPCYSYEPLPGDEKSGEVHLANLDDEKK